MKNISWERPDDSKLTWFWDDYICPKPVKPLTQSFFPYTLQSFYKNQKEIFEGDAEFRGMFVSGYFYIYFKKATSSTFTIEKAEQSIDSWENHWMTEVKGNLNHLGSVDLTKLMDYELANHLTKALQIVTRHWDIEGQVDGPSFMLIQRFVKWYKDRFPDAKENEAYQLIAGEIHIYKKISNEILKLKRDLNSDALCNLKNGELNQLPKSFLSLFNQDLLDYGRKTELMYDIASPTEYEEPASVIKMLVISDQASEKCKDQDIEQLKTNVMNMLKGEEKKEFQRYLTYAQKAMKAKEDHKYYIEQRTPGEIRLICAEIGKRMTENNILQAKEDVGYLYIHELIHYGFGLANPSIFKKVQKRKEEHEKNVNVTPLEEIGGISVEQNKNIKVNGEREKDNQGILLGVPASFGRVKGIARVILDLKDIYTLQKDEILVCQWTDPNWTPVLGLVSGIVTDSGGTLSHAAIVAREYGIPAVVNTTHGTKTIKTGQLIEIDGMEGTIYLR